MGGKKLEEHIGEKYGFLTITGVDRERMNNSKYKNSYVFADCECGVCNKSYNFNKLKRGEIKSCGHLVYQHGRQYKSNIIITKEDYGIIVTSDGSNFYFDLEDEHLLKNKYWYKDDYGYLTHCFVKDGKNNYIRFHRLVMNAKQWEYVDHISREKNDNRKNNLRICTHRENDINKGITKRNTSGVIGVNWNKEKNKWRASITEHKKTIFLGYFTEFHDAVRARLTKEKELFGDFAPQKHLYNEYNI